MSNETNKEISRRNFLMKVGVGLGSVAAAAVAIPVIGALLARCSKTNNGYGVQ